MLPKKLFSIFDLFKLKVNNLIKSQTGTGTVSVSGCTYLIIKYTKIDYEFDEHN